MSFEKGITLTGALKEATTITEKQSLIKSFEHFLQNFHEKEPINLFEQESEWLEKQFVKAQNYIDNGQNSGSQELLNQLKSKKPSPVKQTMIHGDCTTDNVFAIGGEVKLFIDVAGMAIEDPRYDISLTIRRSMDIPELLDSFYQGYTRYSISKEEYQFMIRDCMNFSSLAITLSEDD